jgi:hypothetical protein
MEGSLPGRPVYPRERQSYSFTTATQSANEASYGAEPQVLENEMNVLKIALIACSLCAVVAHAQTAPAAPEQQVAQANAQRAKNAENPSRVAVPPAKAEECVGPVSFCNIYFGS